MTRAVRRTLAACAGIAALELTAVSRTVSAVAEEPPTVIVEMTVYAGNGQPLHGLQAREVILAQEGVQQEILSFEPGPRGRYVLEYVPRSGKPGPVSLRVLRPRAIVMGPDGPTLNVRVKPALRPFERPLVTALDAAEPPRALDHDAFVLRFERAEDGLHHTFVVELPLDRATIRVEGDRAAAHVALMARVKDAAGRVLGRFSLDYPIDAAARESGAIRAQRVVWTSHLHLAPGRYQLETAAQDQASGAAGVRRLDFEAPAVSKGLRLSSVSVLQAGEPLSPHEASPDNPLEYKGHKLFPAHRARFVAGSAGSLPFHAVIYPDPDVAEPVQLSLELWRDGSPAGRGKVALPATAAAGKVDYVGSFELQALAAGAYELKLVVRQGAATAEESARFVLLDAVCSAPRESSSSAPRRGVNPAGDEGDAPLRTPNARK
jgi:hypothetical protein